MGDFVDAILSNKFYLILIACVVGVMIFFAIKKTVKLFIYALIILIVFLAYIYVSSKSVASTFLGQKMKPSVTLSARLPDRQEVEA